MRMIVSMVLILAIALLGSAVYVVTSPPGASLHGRLDREAGEMLSLIPDEGARELIRARSARAAEAAERLVDGNPAGVRVDLRAAAAVVATRLVLATAAAPILVAFLVLGVLAGLYRRDRLCERFGYASLTFSYLGKGTASLSIAGYVFTGLSPIGPPIWMLYAFALAAGGAAVLYFGNLPPKL